MLNMPTPFVTITSSMLGFNSLANLTWDLPEAYTLDIRLK